MHGPPYDLPTWAYVVILVLIAIMLVGEYHEWRACEAAGGALVRTAFGHACMKGVLHP